MFDHLSHVSIVVPNLEAATAHLSNVYGLTVGEVVVNQEQGVRIAYADLGNSKIELMQPLAADGALARFLQKNPGGGIHHISFAVHSLAETLQSLGVNGVQALGKPGARNVHGELIAFVHPRDFLGSLVELEETR